MRHSFWVLLFIAIACIDPLTIKSSNDQQTIVIDGMITDQPGPYTVNISYSLSLNEPLNRQSGVSGASVTIMDDKGNAEKLTEVSAGVYLTSSLKGVVGNTYKLKVITTNGKVYESDAETMLPVGDISKIYYEFVQASSDISDPNNGFNIYLDGTVLPENNGLLRWSWTGVFEIETYPKLHDKLLGNGKNPPPPLTVHDPLPCSGYFWPASPDGYGYSSPCTCCNCWVTEYNDVPLLSDQQFISDGKVKKFNLGFLPASDKYFFDKYHLEVRQMSISQTAYEFWRRVAQQKFNSSNLFQTAPPKTASNIQGITNGALPVIGLFAAASVRTQSIFISRTEIPYTISRIDTLKISCETAYELSTVVKPDYWY